MDKESKRLFDADDYNGFIEKTVEILFNDVKKLNINEKFKNNVLKDIISTRSYIEELVSLHNDYDEIIDKIKKFWAIKFEKIKSSYSTNLNGFNINLDECDNYINIIKGYLNEVSLTEITMRKFSELEITILNLLRQNKNIYDTVSPKCPIRLIAECLERIVVTLETIVKKIRLDKRANETDKSMLCYLENKIVVKNWAYKLPKDMQKRAYQTGLKKLSSEITSGTTRFDDYDLRLILNNISIDELIKFDADLIIPGSYIDSYTSENQLENDIVSHLYGDLDDTFNPNILSYYSIKYGSNEIDYIKKNLACNIIDEYKKESSK